MNYLTSKTINGIKFKVFHSQIDGLNVDFPEAIISIDYTTLQAIIEFLDSIDDI